MVVMLILLCNYLVSRYFNMSFEGKQCSQNWYVVITVSWDYGHEFHEWLLVTELKCLEVDLNLQCGTVRYDLNVENSSDNCMTPQKMSSGHFRPRDLHDKELGMKREMNWQDVVDVVGAITVVSASASMCDILSPARKLVAGDEHRLLPTASTQEELLSS